MGFFSTKTVLVFEEVEFSKQNDFGVYKKLGIFPEKNTKFEM